MEPIEFKEQNVVYAKDQPEYLPLPAYKTEDGEITSCWKLTFREKLSVLFHGKIWINLMTFNRGLSPQRPYAIKPEYLSKMEVTDGE